jgi:ubiquinone/menaquinone biosynthesis C-methylase UbiE
MSDYDRFLEGLPSRLETALPATVLLGQMWWYAFSVLYPAQALKAMGLYRGNEIGQRPTATRVNGEGRYYCELHEEPRYLDGDCVDDQSIQYFDIISPIYGASIEPFTRPIYDEALAIMRPLLAPNARILDVSCGAGMQMLRLAPFVPRGEVVGMDLSAGMVSTAFNTARRRAVRNVAFFQGDVANMPAEFAGRFDATASFGSFHHYPDPRGAVREMHRVLNDTGIAFIVDPGPQWFNTLGAPLAKWADPGWVSFYTGEELRAFFVDAGFAQFYWSEVLPGFGLSIASK